MWFLFAALCLISGSYGLTGCTITVKQTNQTTSLPSPAPLLLKPGAPPTGLGFLLPTDQSGVITLQPGEKVLVACPGPLNYLVPLQPLPVTKTSTLVQDALVTCTASGGFTAGTQTLPFKQLACKLGPSHVAKKTTTPCKGGVIVEIGYQVASVFYKLIDNCFDEARKGVVYSRADMVGGIGGTQGGVFKQAFLTGTPSFYPGVDPEGLYRTASQNSTLHQLLAPGTTPSRHVIKSTLARGLNFVYGSQKRATYYYTNTAPQWQTIAENNWNKVELDVRAYASSHKETLEVYTGTHGILTAPGNRELYLHDEGPGKRFIPVPRLFWKVVVNPKTQAGVAVVGINNPYYRPGQTDPMYQICPDISTTVPWLTWNKAKPEWGVVYCCDVTAFRRAVDSLPTSAVVNKLLV